MDSRSRGPYRSAHLASAERPSSHLNLGNLELALGRFAAAEEAFRTALRIDPRFIEGYVNLADLYRSQAREEDAESTLRDALDIDGIYDSIRDAGLDLPERARASDLGGKLVNCFMKCEADRRGLLRGRRQIMLDDSDVHHHRHSKAAVGGVAATAIGDPAVFVSVDAMHQGPHGGGPVIAIVDLGE